MKIQVSFHMGVFSSKKPPLVGIDISPTAIKLLELSQLRSGRCRVEHYAAETLPKAAITENRITDSRAVGLAIRHALEQSGSQARRAAIAVSGSSVMSKTIQMPKGLSGRELEDMVALEAAQHIPFPIEDVSMDFALLGPGREAGEVDVLLAASRSDTVDERVAVVEQAGLQADVVDLESLAIERACQKLLAESAHQSVAVLALGENSSTLYVMRDGRFVYSREQDFGGLQAADTAEPNPPAKDYPPGISAPLQQKIAQHAQRALQFYASAHPGQPLDALMLAGGTALPGIVPAIQAQVGIPVSLVNPMRGMQASAGIAPGRMHCHAPAMLVACGLALRGVA